MSYNKVFHRKIIKHNEDTTIIPTIDTHVHAVDFLQQTDGMENLIEKMKNSNIEKSVVFGLSVKKKWEYFEPKRPNYYLDDESKCYYYSSTDEVIANEYIKLSKENQKKISPLLCGFDPTDCSSINYIEYMFKKYPFWKGVGEVFFRHDDLTNLTMGEVARINHPACFPIYEYCEKNNLPFLFHHNISSIGDKKHFRYQKELEEVLQKFPNVKFVWCHCGISRRICHTNHSDMINTLLSKYTKLMVDISWVSYDLSVCKDLIPRIEWLTVIKKHVDKFMIGSDVCGHFSLLGKVMARYNNLLQSDYLSKEEIDKIARKNAEKLFFIE
jgi:hypothetical protein